MSRLMSVAMTADAVIERRKTVTRRLNWWEDRNGRRLLQVGDTLTLCRKVQGRKSGEPIDRLAEVEVVDVRREQLQEMFHPLDYGFAETEREGFPGMEPGEFVRRYFVEAQGMSPFDVVTRIEWRYLDDKAFDPRAEAEAYAESWSRAGNTVRFGWLGEDGEVAYALGHDVSEDDFAAALELDGDDWNFQIGYMVITEHSADCAECAQGYCDGGWSARFYDSEIGTESIPVTWWSA